MKHTIAFWAAIVVLVVGVGYVGYKFVVPNAQAAPMLQSVQSEQMAPRLQSEQKSARPQRYYVAAPEPQKSVLEDVLNSIDKIIATLGSIVALLIAIKTLKGAKLETAARKTRRASPKQEK